MTDTTNSNVNTTSSELSANAQAIARMKEHITTSNFSSEDLRLIRSRVHNAMIKYFEDEDFRKQSQLIMAYISNEIRGATAVERLSEIVMPSTK